jgi:y4mF family transcriptional regulator
MIPNGKMMDSRSIGNIVRKERKRAGLRQDELAGAAGVGIRFIVELEAGKPTLQIGKLLRVLDTLGIKVTLSWPDGGTVE